jgi:hypothetical protein
VVVVLVAVLLMSASAYGASCKGTPGNGTTPPGERASPSWYGNGELWTFGLVRFVANPHGTGMPEINADGSITNKYLWLGKRTSATPPLDRIRLVISGRRLDGPGRFKKSGRGAGWNSKALYWPSYLTFPIAGCWQVTARVNKGPRLRFVVAVEAPPATARAS